MDRPSTGNRLCRHRPVATVAIIAAVVLADTLVAAAAAAKRSRFTFL